MNPSRLNTSVTKTTGEMRQIHCFLVVLLAVISINALKKRYDGYLVYSIDSFRLIHLGLFRDILLSVVPTTEEHLQFLSNLETENEVEMEEEELICIELILLPFRSLFGMKYVEMDLYM